MTATRDAATPRHDRGAAADSQSAVRCIGVTKRFDVVRALENLTFSAAAGEVHAILGENGAGKSTFVKILGGTLTADAGELRLFGESVRFGTPRDARRHGVSVAYQELSLASELTVAQNIWITHTRANRIGLLPRRALVQQTHDLIAEWEAPALDPEERVKNLPVAQRQVVEILKSIAGGSRVIVFDESTAALSAAETEWALGLTRKLAQQGTLVIYISHRIGEIREVADRVTIFRNGQAVKTGTPTNMTDGDMIEAMLGRKPQALYPPSSVVPNNDVIALSVNGLRGGRLRDATFDLCEGEILGVGGLQGQGQSDLLFSLFGMTTAAGSISVYGKQRRVRSPRDSLAAGIVLVPEDRRLQGLLMTKTIRENISLPSLGRLTSAGFLSPWKEIDLVDGAIARRNVIATNAEQSVSTLSGGNQQKVVVAKLLELKAPILLLDDFTRGIDVGTKGDLFRLLRELTEQRHSIIFYSSDAQELVHMCDRILVLLDGVITAQLVGDDRTEDNVVRASFGLFGPEQEA